MIGIVGYGAYIPCYRLRADAIAAQWGRERGSTILEKSVPGMDEDTLTIAVEASRQALARAGVDRKAIGAVYVGSESHPYAVKPTGTMLVEALGLGPHLHVVDMEFACKAGTEAMYCAYSHTKSGEMAYALAVGADTSQGAPSDALEYTASAASAALLFGRGAGVIAEVLATHSYTSDTPDFWRREAQFYPSHAGRFTGDPAYFRHVLACARAILEKTGCKPADFRHVVFHMPNDKFPERAAKVLGFTEKQLEAGFVVRNLGNPYSASSPVGLSSVLDVAEPDDRILMVSFGSGAGSDAFVFRATESLREVRKGPPTVREQLLGRRIYLDYAGYARYRGKILMRD